MQKGTLCMQRLPLIRTGMNTWSHLRKLHWPKRLLVVLCNLSSQEHVNLWGWCIQCFHRSTTTKAGFLHLPRQSCQRLVGSSQKIPTNSRWAHDPGPWCYARPSRITLPLGKACWQNPLRHRLHSNCPQTMNLLWQDTQWTCSLHATGWWFCNICTLQTHCKPRPGPNQWPPIYSNKLPGPPHTIQWPWHPTDKNYIKVSCKTYIDRISHTHIQQGWLKNYLKPDRPTPLPTTAQFLKDIQTTKRDPNQTAQKTLKKKWALAIAVKLDNECTLWCAVDPIYHLLQSNSPSTTRAWQRYTLTESDMHWRWIIFLGVSSSLGQRVNEILQHK